LFQTVASFFTYVSQGSATTRLSCGGTFGDQPFAIYCWVRWWKNLETCQHLV